MPKILISDPISPDGVAFLAARAEVDTKYGMEPAELLLSWATTTLWWSAVRQKSPPK